MSKNYSGGSRASQSKSKRGHSASVHGNPPSAPYGHRDEEGPLERKGSKSHLPGQKQKAILIDIIEPGTSQEAADLRLLELESLVDTFGGVVVVKTVQRKATPDYSNYIGTGKLQELIAIGQEVGAKILVVNNMLKPRQLYNLNESLREAEMEAWDRVDLILKIFSKHAKTTEAKLQIELASIRHMGPRIFNMGIELSRQAGALGVRAGQGESNTEMMKRHLRTQELNIVAKLKQYERVRAGHREQRRRSNFQTVAIVGYTNAGKSSLLNALTKKGAYVADQLFATLDTRVGKLYLPQLQKEILLSDTIGFIQDLPPALIQAFKSTLSETIEADLLLHVIDINDSQLHMKIHVVEVILTQLGMADKPEIYVFNKIDMVDYRSLIDKKSDSGPVPETGGLIKAGIGVAELLGWVDEETAKKEAQLRQGPNDPTHLKKHHAHYTPVFVSAHQKMNLDKLIATIEKALKQN